MITFGVGISMGAVVDLKMVQTKRGADRLSKLRCCEERADE